MAEWIARFDLVNGREREVWFDYKMPVKSLIAIGNFCGKRAQIVTARF